MRPVPGASILFVVVTLAVALLWRSSVLHQSACGEVNVLPLGVHRVSVRVMPPRQKRLDTEEDDVPHKLEADAALGAGLVDVTSHLSSSHQAAGSPERLRI